MWVTIFSPSYNTCFSTYYSIVKPAIGTYLGFCLWHHFTFGTNFFFYWSTNTEIMLHSKQPWNSGLIITSIYFLFMVLKTSHRLSSSSRLQVEFMCFYIFSVKQLFRMYPSQQYKKPRYQSQTIQICLKL